MSIVTITKNSDRPNLAPSRASAKLFGRSLGGSIWQFQFAKASDSAEAVKIPLWSITKFYGVAYKDPACSDVSVQKTLLTSWSSLWNTVAVLSMPPVKILLVLLAFMSSARIPASISGIEAAWRPEWDASWTKFRILSAVTSSSGTDLPLFFLSLVSTSAFSSTLSAVS